MSSASVGSGSGSGGPRSQSARLPAVGQWFGPYQLIGALGTGGMGTVYHARDSRSGRELALKLLKRPEEATARERFAREGAITASLNHPGIVRVHSAGEYAGFSYLDYELVEGASSLEDAFTSLDVLERIALVRDAARALGYAHAQGVIHRDVKPDNLLVDGTGRLRVADFGLATAQDLDRLTKTGAYVGTPFYMSPEQFDSREEIGPHSDVWALGVILYQALTGRLPFEATELYRLISEITDANYPFPNELDATVPRALEAVCLKAMTFDHSGRYVDGNALADDLDRGLSGEQVLAQGPPSKLNRFVRRRKSLLTVGFLCAVVLAACAVLVVRYMSAALPAAPPPVVPEEPVVTVEPPESVVDRLHAELTDEASAVLRGRLAQAWLERFPDDPRGATVRDVRYAARKEEPLWRLPYESVKTAAWLDDDTVVVRSDKILKILSLNGTEPEELASLVVSPVRILATVLATAPSGRQLAYNSIKKCVVVTRTGEPVWTKTFDGRVEAIAYNPDGSTLAVSGYFPGIHILDAATGDSVDVVGDRTNENTLAISPGGRFIVSGASDTDRDREQVRIWSKGKLVVSQDVGERVEAVAFIDEHRALASGSTGEVIVIDAVSGDKKGLRGSDVGFNIVAHQVGEACLTVGPKGGRFYTASRGRTSDRGFNDVAVWDSDSTELLGRYLARKEYRYEAIAVSPNGMRLAICSIVPGVFEIWHTEGLREEPLEK